MSGGKKATRGTPQGGVVSPLLANIYMHRFIKAFRQYGLDRAVRRGARELRGRLRGALPAGSRRGARDDPALDDQHRARAERGQDVRARRPMRVLRLPRLHLRTDVLAADRRTLQLGATPSKKAVAAIRETIRAAAAAGKPGTVGGRAVRARTAPCGAGPTTSATARWRRRGTMWSCYVYHARPPLSPPPAQGAGARQRQFPMQRVFGELGVRRRSTACPRLAAANASA